jgi:hypothetical protein
MDDREELLEEIAFIIEKDSLSILLIRNVIFGIIFLLAILFPKIYISNKIYVYSVKINKLLNEFYSLRAENSILISKIEKIKFKNELQKFNFNQIK